VSTVKSPLDAQARTTTGTALQGALVDLIDLSLQAKQAHWNLVGKNFRSLHLQLDDVVATARDHSDILAERAITVGGQSRRPGRHGSGPKPAPADRGWLPRG
jgi:starvation-inducible DNA-binding protein